MDKELFDQVSFRCSRLTTQAYSTSFSFGIRCLQKELRDPIRAIYGFVRFADEIVDTFHQYDKAELLERFRQDALKAIDDGISLNPILNSFQLTVNRFGIEPDLYEQFLASMKMDLTVTRHDAPSVQQYIGGSAEAVGLMCLRVFTHGDPSLYDALKKPAVALGSAFQKVNFLRDLQEDRSALGRAYFPTAEFAPLRQSVKVEIEKDIEADFNAAFPGIRRLPRSSRWGVYLAYLYYSTLFRKLRNVSAHAVEERRLRIDNFRKLSLLAYSYVRHQLNLI